MIIVVFRYDAGNVTPLSTSYDDGLHPRRFTPAADRGLTIQKNSLPAVPRRGPEAGILRMEDDFSWFWYELN
jgi:hypothetical protein